MSDLPRFRCFRQKCLNRARQARGHRADAAGLLRGVIFLAGLASPFVVALLAR